MVVIRELDENEEEVVRTPEEVAAAAERGSMALRRGYDRMIARRVKMALRRLDFDSRKILDRRQTPYSVVVDETNYKDVDADAFLGIPKAPCYCCTLRSQELQEALLRQQKRD
uniref:Uncharacterized protein n=1 Tax=Oryza barthii TaxID=65489 RepID=A0A0D3F540_9ORYZ